MSGINPVLDAYATTTDRAQATIWLDGIQACDDAMAWTKARNQSGEIHDCVSARLVSAPGGWSVCVGPKSVPCTEWTEYLTNKETENV